MEGEGVDWVQLVQDSDKSQVRVIMAVNLRVSYSAGNFLAICETISFSRWALLHVVS
jgi:hypothetical protein